MSKGEIEMNSYEAAAEMPIEKEILMAFEMRYKGSLQ